jgi:hypothetical protein
MPAQDESEQRSQAATARPLAHQSSHQRADRLTPLPDSLSHATGRRPHGCSPQPAETLSSPKPRMRKVVASAKRKRASATGSR